MVFGSKRPKAQAATNVKAELPIKPKFDPGAGEGDSRSEAEALLSATSRDLEQGPKTPKNDPNDPKNDPKTPKAQEDPRKDGKDPGEQPMNFTLTSDRGEEEREVEVEYLVRLKAETSPSLLRYTSAAVLIFSSLVALEGIFRAQGLRFLLQCLYQACLSFMALIFEFNDKEWTYPPGIKGVRESLRVSANFLTRSLGRGSLYVFLSSWWLWYCWSLQVKGVHLTAAAMLLLVGSLNGAAFTFGLTKLDVEVLDKRYLEGPPAGSREGAEGGEGEGEGEEEHYNDESDLE